MYVYASIFMCGYAYYFAVKIPIYSLAINL